MTLQNLSHTSEVQPHSTLEALRETTALLTGETNARAKLRKHTSGGAVP
jgi:hypothetical protein